MRDIPVADPLNVLVSSETKFVRQGGNVPSMITGAAKASTPFGPLAGRTPIHITNNGEDLAIVDFLCGGTPVSIAVAGDNLHGLIRALIAQASELHAARLAHEFDTAMAEVSA